MVVLWGLWWWGRGRRHYLSLGLSVLMVRFTVILRPFQSPVALATSSPTFFGDMPRGLILRARADVAPTSPTVHLRYRTLVSLGSNFSSMVEAAGVRWTQIWDNGRKLHPPPLSWKPKVAKVYLLFNFFLISFQREREGERQEEKHPCVREMLIGCLSHAPNWGPGLKSRHVSWPGIQPASFLFAGPRSIHWATPARVGQSIFKCLFNPHPRICLLILEREERTGRGWERG